MIGAGLEVQFREHLLTLRPGAATSDISRAGRMFRHVPKDLKVKLITKPSNGLGNGPIFRDNGSDIWGEGNALALKPWVLPDTVYQLLHVAPLPASVPPPKCSAASNDCSAFNDCSAYNDSSG